MNEAAKHGRHCSGCGDPEHDRRQCPKLSYRNSRGRGFDPWLDLEWEEHDEAREIVAKHPDGMTLEQVGNVLGVTRERVRQIEAIALEKLRTGLDAAQTVDVKGVTAALTQCEECFEFFPRANRRKYCDDHVGLERTPRCRPVAPVAASHPDSDRHGRPRARHPAAAPVVSRTVGNTALRRFLDPQLEAFEVFASSFLVELPTFDIALDHLPVGFY